MDREKLQTEDSNQIGIFMSSLRAKPQRHVANSKHELVFPSESDECKPPQERKIEENSDGQNHRLRQD